MKEIKGVWDFYDIDAICESSTVLIYVSFTSSFFNRESVKNGS